MSRAELAEAVSEYLWRTTGTHSALDAHAIARYERGRVTWPSARYRAGLRAVLGVPTDAGLGFHAVRRRRGPTSKAETFSPNGAVRAEGSGMDSEDLLVLDAVETSVPRWVGAVEVEYVRATTRAVAMSENAFGGGLSYGAGLSQLRWSKQLLGARASDTVRRELFESVGNLGGVVAYSAFDAGMFEVADRSFRFALRCAERADSWELRANILAEMSRKATYLNDLDGALTLVEHAQVREDRLSRSTRAMLWTLRARTLALRGTFHAVEDNIVRADECFALRDPKYAPPWLCYYDEAEHYGSTGKALIPLAVDSRRPEVAASRLRRAVTMHDSRYRRSRVFSSIRLASLLLAVGDPAEAVSVGHQALPDAKRLRSARIATELAGLARVAGTHDQREDIAELRHEASAAASAAT
ncbi:hypothetical protein J4H86_19985 [Spiractinospora alimapuensis]|uniref:hypothetical protein n=1 Tax=Spiractinospora alimapuensis TaxID=2820884 RepID=UPI001F46446F|nr:hypothetical protein [Spiractinospora alimapuensis]QVQ51094.1 hypothetical protein J4H86_19985 [Spiractinospora alimapuensis]